VRYVEFRFVGDGGRDKFSEGDIGRRVSRLAAEFELFEPLNGFALVGDNLRLPDQSNRHEAHGDDAQDENESDVGFGSGKPKNATKPGHGKGSPSTHRSIERFVQFWFDSLRGRPNLPSESVAIGGP
jgi:hypothetical protein